MSKLRFAAIVAWFAAAGYLNLFPVGYANENAKAKIAGHGVQEIVFATREDGNDGHWYANIGYWSYDENNMLYGKGGRLCKVNIETGDLVTLIDDPKGTVRDPVVHYDAEKILFSWRQGESRVFHLYECDLYGKNITQLTDGDYDDIEPCYLPDGGIVFVSGRGKRFVNCWLTQVAILYRCDGDGKNITQLSANLEHDNTPWVLPDGRIVYQRWEYIDRSQVNFHHLWTMNPDGTNQMIYFGNLHPGGLYIDARPIPNSDALVFINSPGHGSCEHSGHVAVVESNRGPDDQGALVNLSDDASYRDPWPLSDDLFLVAKGRQIAAMNRDGNETVIFTLPESFGSSVNLQEPRPVIRRQREHVIAPRVDPAQTTGLMKKLDGEHYDVKLSSHEQKMIRYWIETGACYPGTYAALGHGSIGGYQQNRQIDEDKDWPTSAAFARVITQRCTECHQHKLNLPTPTTMSDEIGISFWNFDVTDPRFRFSRHRMFNLTEPVNSRFLLGPLAKNAGGLGLCSEVVFENKQDADYQSLLAHITAGKEFLETKLTRFDMPNFRPRDEYFRQLKQYGILPECFDPETDSFDVYQLDREYWKSLWYQPR